jgi:hypothetical protein
LGGEGRGGGPDLAVANYNDKTVSVLLNTTPAGATTATFAAQQTFAVGTGPYTVVTGDLDGDGRPDLAIPNSGDKTVSVLLNTTADGSGTATFAAQQTFQVGTAVFSSVAVGDFNGDGRPDLTAANSVDKTVSVLLNTTAPFVNTVPPVVGQFGSTGVWRYNRLTGAWMQLTAANAAALVTDPSGDVAADFPGNGVWLYKPAAGWKMINGVDATLLALDQLGDVVAEFPGFGVGEYIPSAGWRALTLANATLLAVDALGDVTAEFPGAGLWQFRVSTGFRQINGVDATLLAVDPLGDVAANFMGVGVGEYSLATGWHLVNGVEARSLGFDQYGNLLAQFTGFGIGLYQPTIGWHPVIPAYATPLDFQLNGDIVGDFAGFGVWEFDPYRGWFQLRASEASVLAVA